jgi:C1A family cysteine protease
MKGLLLALFFTSAPALAQGYLPLPRDKADARPYRALNLGDVGELPEAYDSRDEGYVTPIKQQGSCGSCWAFARTKAFEAALLNIGREIDVDLAEQDTLVNDRSSYGCNGGFMDGDFEVEQGQTTEEECPYRGSHRFRCQGTKYAQAVSWAMLGGRRSAPSVDELRAAIHKYKVLAVTVAAGRSFSPNREGRITTCGSRGVNHMVTLVGYRPAPNGGYEFLIANSWGEGWGDGGYAWSKQGCNQLASSAGDAALFFTAD